MVVVIRRVSLVLVLVSVLCTLVPLTYASPPDQTWRPGIYDDADFDDVVTFLATTEITPSKPPAAPLFVPIVVAVPHGAVEVRPAAPVPSASSRAPPTLRAII